MERAGPPLDQRPAPVAQQAAASRLAREHPTSTITSLPAACCVALPSTWSRTPPRGERQPRRAAAVRDFRLRQPGPDRRCGAVTVSVNGSGELALSSLPRRRALRARSRELRRTRLCHGRRRTSARVAPAAGPAPGHARSAHDPAGVLRGSPSTARMRAIDHAATSLDRLIAASGPWKVNPP